jgi:hypothetical protein
MVSIWRAGLFVFILEYGCKSYRGLDGSRIAFLYEGKAYAIKDHGVLLPPIEN